MQDQSLSSEQRYFITTAIPYVNARPHLGFALELVQTDAIARYHRLAGQDVRFLTGTDENSLSNVQAAEAEGIETQELVERNARFFSGLKEELDISYNDFIRTSTDPRHLDGARKLWEACNDAGDIYKKAYSGLYCVNCEQFYLEEELVEGLCPEHKTKPDLIEEENYFFRLSKYSDWLAQLIESDELRIIPQTRKNEVLSFIRMGLKDFSISRSRQRARGWGVPIPNDLDQVMYVWFDALSNYINALGYATGGELFEKYWLENPNRVHVIGKGIIRFHAVYWPAMLCSAGLPIPKTIFVHGYITVHGTKMSKTLGNVVDPVELASQYGVDPLRYYLLRRVPPADDGNFTLDNFVQSFNTDLADQLGNLVSRVIGMISRYYDGVVPGPGPQVDGDAAVRKKAAELKGRLDSAIAGFDPQEALDAIWDLVAEANRYVVQMEPWNLAKTRDDESSEARLAAVLYSLAEVLRLVACATAAFIPRTAHSIASTLGIEIPETFGTCFQWGGYTPGTKLNPGPNLFPKLDIIAGP